MSEHPLSWIEVALGDLLIFNYGKSLPNSDRSGSGFPVYGSNGIVGYHDSALTDGETLIIGRKGSVGEIHFSPKSCFPIDTTYYVDQFYGMPVKYWFYQLKSLHLSQLNKATAIPGLNREDVYHTKIYLPPLNEQKRIADKLDSLLDRVDICRERLDCVPKILKRFRQSVLIAAISGQLTLDWRNGQNIDEWSYERAEDVCDKVQSGGTPKEGFISEVGIPFLKIYNIVDQKIDFEYRPQFVSELVHQTTLAKSRAKPGDVLMNIVGPPLGKVAIVPDRFPEWNINQAITLFRPSERIITGWLYYLLYSGNSVSEILHETRGSAGQSNISLSQCRSFIFPVPPIDEQYEIVRCINELFAYADLIEMRYQNTLVKIKQLIVVILNKAFSGELVPQDLNEESASLLLEKIRNEKINIDVEKKITRIFHRSTKANLKIPMKQLSDYAENLHSAFRTLVDKSDARRLFNQAGFNSEEVLHFYEALRSIPEIRDNFEQFRQEHPSQKQNSILKPVTAENSHFRLIELWLEDFKNLADYTIKFDVSHSIDIVLGWNGTGKSNLFEALVIIFRDLHKWIKGEQWSKQQMKGYRLCYEINAQTVYISWNPSEMKSPLLRIGGIQKNNNELDKLIRISKNQLPLPRFIFGYYSGPTNRLAEHFFPMNKDHYDRLRDAISDDPETLVSLLEERRFFCAENHHAKYVLLAFFHREDPTINQFLEERLRIVGFESALFIIREPRWAQKGQTTENFWGARGVMRRVMERLRQFAIAPIVVKQKVREGYRSRSEDHYYFFLPDLQSLHAFAAEYQNARTFFLALESIDFSELIYDVKIQVRVKSTNTEQIAITFHELSEGEQQLLMVLGLMRFTKSHQSLVLLDEPDTHLNPHWSVDYLKLLTSVMSENIGESEEQQTSQILMSTHDPLVIASLLKEQIHLLKRDWQTGICKWEQPSVDPRGLGFTGILTSEMFGMRSDLDEETLTDLDTKVRLFAREGSMTPQEIIELEEVNKRLEDAGFKKAFSDPYYAAFIRAWSRRYSNLMAGVQFLNSDQQKEIDRIARDILEESLAELQSEVIN